MKFSLSVASLALVTLTQAACQAQLPVTSGLSLWLKADAGVTSDASGYVSAWADQSSANHHAQQTTASQQPLRINAALNGKPVLRFDGVDDYLPLNGQVLTSQTFTIFAVVSDNRQDSELREIFSNWTETNMWTSVFFGTAGLETVRTRLSDDFDMGGVLTNPTTHFIYTGINGDTDASVYQNFDLLASKGAPLSERDLTGPYKIGGLQGWGEYWQGDIAEVLVYDRALTPAEIQQIWNYLGIKYGLIAPPPVRLGWQNTQNGDVSYWQLNGTSLASSNYIARAVPLAWQLVGSLDLNADGSNDLLWHNTQTGDVSYWIMNGTARTATSGYIFRNVPLAWRPVATADLNNDGKKDILWQNTQTGDVTYWRMEGTTITDKGYIARAVPTVWQIVAALDLNGDSKPDLLWRNSSTGDLTYWYLNGTTMMGTGYVSRGVPLVWRIGAVADIDSDGDEDLVWQNSSIGDVTYWLMNGKAIAGTGYLYRSVPLAWQLRTAF